MNTKELENNIEELQAVRNELLAARKYEEAISLGWRILDLQQELFTQISNDIHKQGEDIIKKFQNGIEL